MSINYPTILDALINPLATDSENDVPHAEQHSDINDAIEALEVKIGINNSTDSSSIDYKLYHKKPFIAVGTIAIESDYVCDGTDDDIQIQLALDYVASIGGGTVLLRAGTYNVSASVEYSSNTRLIGEGRGATIINLVGTLGNSCGIIQPKDYGSSDPNKSIPLASNVTIQHLSIDGNSVGGAPWFECLIMRFVTNGYVDDVETYGASEVGIEAHTQTYLSGVDIEPQPIIVTNCFSHDNIGGQGFQLGSGNFSNLVSSNNYIGFDIVSNYNLGSTSGTILNNCYAYKNELGSLINFQFEQYMHNCIINACMFIDNTKAGIDIQLQGVVVSNCLITKNGWNGIIVEESYVSIINNWVKNNGQAVVADIGKSGIRVSSGSADDVTIHGNTCFDDQNSGTQLYGVVFDYPNTVTNCIVENNNLYNNATSAFDSDTMVGTGVIIKNNFGYNPIGISSITVNASPFTYTAGTSPETVYISGGTVSAIVKGGVTLFANTGHSVELEPHTAVVVTYSGTPTMSKDIH
jgi:hypothetical protein